MFIRKKGEWIPDKIDKNLSIKVNPTAEGYTVDYNILAHFFGKLPLLKEFSIAFAISAVDEDGKIYLEFLANTDKKDAETWISITRPNYYQGK